MKLPGTAAIVYIYWPFEAVYEQMKAKLVGQEATQVGRACARGPNAAGGW